MIFLGSDHRGFKIKEELKKYLDEIKEEYIDCGTDSEESADYPVIAKAVCNEVVKAQAKGVLICGTGIGMSIVANKFKGIRCALCYNEDSAKFSKMHNNSNVLALCANDNSAEKNIEIFKAWISTEFEGERHQKRLDLIEEIETENFK